MNDNYAIFVTLSASEGSQKPRRKNITTMKRYIKPTCEIIEVEISAILKASIYMGGNEEGIENPDEEQLGKEHRGDWDNIWGNM